MRALVWSNRRPGAEDTVFHHRLLLSLKQWYHVQPFLLPRAQGLTRLLLPFLPSFLVAFPMR
jgi:hypothetical protein